MAVVARFVPAYNPADDKAEIKPAWSEDAPSYTHPTLSAATLVPAGGNNYQPRVTYTF